MNEPRTPQAQVDEESAPLSALDHQRLARVERSITRARELRAWWEGKSGRWLPQYDGKTLSDVVSSGTYPNCFPLTRPHAVSPETEANFGFFDVAQVDGEHRDVMGLFQQTLFDEPRRYFIQNAIDAQAAVDDWHQDIREFTLGHLIRLTGFHETAPYYDPSRRPTEPWVRPFSWCPSEEDRRGGFGVTQIYYRRANGGGVGKFRDVDRLRVDVRSVQRGLYDWVVLGIRIHDLYLRHPATERITLPIQDEVLAILTPDFVFDESDRPGVRGVYGFGWAALEDPAEEGPAFLWHRPQFGFQMNQFVVQDNGRVLARTMMVTERLQRMVDFSPLELAKWVADRASFGVSDWGPGIVDRASMGLVPSAFRFGAEIAARAAPALPFSRFMSASASGFRFDPFSAFLAAMSSVPGGMLSAMCISYDELLRSLLSDVVRSQLSTIIASRGAWRAVPRWSDASTLPAWVTAHA